MPAALVKSFAQRARVPLARAEHLWAKAKAVVKEQYKIDEPGSGDAATRYYKLVVGTMKKMLKLEDAPRPIAIDPELVEQLRSAGMGHVADRLLES